MYAHIQVQLQLCRGQRTTVFEPSSFCLKNLGSKVRSLCSGGGAFPRELSSQPKADLVFCGSGTEPRSSGKVSTLINWAARIPSLQPCSLGHPYLSQWSSKNYPRKPGVTHSKWLEPEGRNHWFTIFCVSLFWSISILPGQPRRWWSWFQCGQ